MRNILITIIISFILPLFLNSQTKVLRFPNSSDTHITFCHAGDIFTVPIEGGLARRITSSDGLEMYPRFSPDGNTIAFAAEYEGSQQVYTVPSVGGSPEQRTFKMDMQSVPERMGPNKIILEWANDGNDILFRSRHESWHILGGKLFKVPSDGHLLEELPLPTSGYASLSPDGNKVAYNRIFREYRTWKRYRGGQVDEIWIYDFNTKELEQITDNNSQDIMPMWVGEKIYYISDRTGTLNLYAYDLNTKQEKQITNTDNYDVKFPSRGANHIAFEMGGEIYLMDYATESVKKVEIEVREDFPHSRPEIKSVKDNINYSTVSNDGKRAVFSARGDIFVVAKKKGITKNLTNSSNAHDRNPVWSPDGKWIAFVSDESGQDEIYLVKPDGSQKKQLTDDYESYRYELKWSPDSKKLMSSDKMMKLYYYDIESGNRTDVTRSEYWEIRNAVWSPDSKWIAYTDYVDTKITGVYLHSTDNGQNSLVSSEYFNAGSPVFTPGANYLFYVSQRTYNASVSSHEWNFQYKDMSKIYGVPLKKGGKSLFLFEGIEDKEEKKEDEDKDEEVNVEIDLDKIKDRVFEVPTAAGNYYNLYPSKDHKMYYVRTSTGSKPTTYVYDFNKKEESKVGDFYMWDVSADEKHFFIKENSDYYITDFKDNVKLSSDDKLDLSNLETKIVKATEWEQIFYEGWRQMKDFFYDPNMHGVDWQKMKEKYEVFLPHIHHRTDLTYIMGEMISELNVGHAYVGGGDMPEVKDISIGLLGAEYELDNGNWKIANIFEGRNWEEKTRSPLTEPGIDVEEGMYLLAIDDEELSESFTPSMALENKAEEYVKITVNDSPNMSGAEKFYVKTIKSDKGLRYFNWVEERRRIVNEKTDGKVGYIHIPDMGLGNGLNEFVKYFYSQLDKEGLIIDDRYNGGGNVSPMIIERLRREVAIAQYIRNQRKISGKPDGTFTGPMVCLINEMSMSDGDLFPYQFRQYGLGKLIGKRTWGGVIGIRGSLPFLDGGYMMKPEFANFGADGDWVLEGKGIAPDIEVDNHPAKELEGIDQQLNRAIEEILKEIENFDDSKRLPPVPDKFPIKSKEREE